MKKPEILLVVAVLLIVAVALFAAFNPHVGESRHNEAGNETAEHAQDELATEIEKGNAELAHDQVLAANPESGFENNSENLNETNRTQNPIRIQAK